MTAQLSHNMNPPSDLLETFRPSELPGSDRLGAYHSMMLFTRETDA